MKIAVILVMLFVSNEGIEQKTKHVPEGMPTCAAAAAVINERLGDKGQAHCFKMAVPFEFEEEAKSKPREYNL